MSLPRFIGKSEEDFIVIQEQEYNHLVKVLRLKVGDIVEINTLDGNVFKCEIVDIGKKLAKVKILEKINIEEEYKKITVFQCVPNHLSKIDDIIEPLSQLGVYKFVPVLSKNSAVKESDIIKKLEKWEKIALNSIKQCKRLYPMVIEKPKKIYNINKEGDLNIVFYEKETSNSIKMFLGKDYNSASVIIGNEGGFTEEEIDFLKKVGFNSVSLGKNILRLETAVIVGICQTKFILS